MAKNIPLHNQKVIFDDETILTYSSCATYLKEILTMKNFITISCFFLFANTLIGQEATQTRNNYKSDTLQGRHFGDFYKPTTGLIKNDTLNIETPYFIKCKGVKSEEDRRNCFSDIFYENLRKKLRVPSIKEGGVELVVEFKVNKEGKVEDIKFIESNDVTGEFEKEVVRVLKKLPELIPAKKDGKIVKVAYQFPIRVKNP